MWSNILSQLRRNWFKLFCLGILIYIFFQKDLSFQVNMRAPAGSEPPAAAETPRERLSDAGVPEQASLLDRMHIPLFGSAGSNPDCTAALAAVADERRLAYLKRFARVAISERQKFGIPSSLILASALLHSTAGTGALAQEANNHFALPADDTWQGLVYEKDGKKYRMYENAWSSFRDHSEYLAGLLRAADQIPAIGNQEAWLQLLPELNYIADPAFVEIAPELIREYQLEQLDRK